MTQIGANPTGRRPAVIAPAEEEFLTEAWIEIFDLHKNKERDEPARESYYAPLLDSPAFASFASSQLSSLRGEMDGRAFSQFPEEPNFGMKATMRMLSSFRSTLH